ncbi:ergothioneine biosynthesis protein EgtC [Marinitenerispora sediminis]|uniref:ergothioneine biosynthesis protein EgtC n=1 Tax=Marinitenerispora sediminis TaxID=1931232 RepID=UPI000DF1BDA6|nr:ergothioneine biosynthesis protein EgtC [Marinitenerispora sediminis]RCV56834.1 ergothioneine biosynthesis protein EgtC [Marinitenerispora sediminis]RCV59009.1 ergothioneine biosynthesis protein EgtC [Marinitenerispora sediminis]
MCRHMAYLGPPVDLHTLLYAPKRSLHSQSYAPREQRHGTVNADGFGVGWYAGGADPAAAEPPVRYRRSMPIWADTSFADVARVVRAGCVVAAVRDATVGFPVDESCAQPFRGDGRLFSHNGAASDYEALADRLGTPVPTGVPDVRAPVDSAPLFGLAVRLWRKGEPLGGALAGVAEAARSCSPGRYNLLAADGTRLAATACGDTLYVRQGPGTVVVASEPCDDEPGWRRVPDESLLTATAHSVRITPIG